jgi:hypothetical protein
MSQISLDVECRPGSSIGDCFKEGIELSQRIGIDVHFKFNGVTCFAVADGDIDYGCEQWNEAMSSNRQYKFAHSRK